MPSEEDFQNLKDQVQALANQLNQARNRIDELEDFATDHIGLDWGESLVDINAPHPNISVNTIESGGGTIRQDVNGMQVKTGGNSTAAIHFVENLVANLANVDRSLVKGWAGGDSSGIILDTVLGGAIVTEIYMDQSNFWALFEIAGTVAAAWKLVPGSGAGARGAFSLNHSSATMLALGQVTADPTNVTASTDGWVWYRTDTDRARMRVNNATVNVVTDGGGSELTIATGVIAITENYHRVDTQSDAASDDLDTINGGSIGQILVLRAENDARSVVAKDGTGNLKLAGDCTLDNSEDTLTLIYNGTNWLELARSNNGA